MLEDRGPKRRMEVDDRTEVVKQDREWAYPWVQVGNRSSGSRPRVKVGSGRSEETSNDAIYTRAVGER